MSEPRSAEVLPCDSDATTVPPETLNDEHRHKFEFQALQNLAAIANGTERGFHDNTELADSQDDEAQGRPTQNMSRGVLTKALSEEKAFFILSGARSKARKAALERKRAMVRASILRDVALSAEELSSIAHTNVEMAREEERKAEDAYNLSVVCEQKKSARKQPDTAPALQHIEEYKKSLVNAIVSSSHGGRNRSQTQAAEILCQELHKEVAKTVLRFHRENISRNEQESFDL